METESKTFIKKNLKEFDFKKIVCFKNPKNYRSWYVERINPNHVAILWGKRRRKDKGNNPIKIAKLFFQFLPLTFGLSVIGWIDALTGYVFDLVFQVGIVSLLIACLVSVVLYSPVFIIHRRAVFG